MGKRVQRALASAIFHVKHFLIHCADWRYVSLWLVFSITHPCFEPPYAQWVTLDDGSVARAVNNYFREGFWRSENGGIRSRVGAQHRMLSTYLNELATAGFALERMLEPLATGEHARQVAGNREVPSLLLVRARCL